MQKALQGGKFRKMIYHQAKDPDSYQTIFYKQIGLKRRSASLPENDWANDQIGSIYTYGRMDSIQFGIGDYTIPEDFFVEFQYDTEYLHAGIIYEGITYSLVENRMEKSAIPSPFLAIEQASGGINCWKHGQHFKGVEISIEMNYLKKKILPYLGASDDSLDFLVKNVRHIHLPKELTDLILQVQSLLESRSMTPALLLALSTSFTALLIRQANRAFSLETDPFEFALMSIKKSLPPMICFVIIPIPLSLSMRSVRHLASENKS